MAEHLEQIAQSVQEVYALALIEMAESAGDLDGVADEVAQLANLIDTQADLARLLSNRVMTIDQRGETIDHLFKNNVSDLLYRFIRVVNDKNRLDLLAEIVHVFAKLVDKRQGIIEAEAYVATAFDEQQLSDLAIKLGEALQGNVILKQVVDPQLIGGLKLRIGDQLIDGSTATQLRLIEQKLITAGRDQASSKLAEIIEN